MGALAPVSVGYMARELGWAMQPSFFDEKKKYLKKLIFKEGKKTGKANNTRWKR